MMDQIKIGKFIAEMRKEQNLTQIDLAERVGISNKTISKWECGNGMPDYAVMENLCDILKINVNELLSGERLPSQEYSRKAEENMMSLMQESSENHKREKREYLFVGLGTIVLLILVLWAITMLWGVDGQSEISNFLDLPTILFIFIVTTVVLFIARAGKDFLKGFTFAIKSVASNSHHEIKKSLLAMKMGMVTVNVAGMLAFVIAAVITLKEWARSTGEHEAIAAGIAVALLGIVYSLVMTLILIPIYIRLKAKLVEE